MDVMEIVLIILGAGIFILSFLLPAGKKNDEKDNAKISEESVREMVGQEIDSARSQISGIVDETITYAMEKTERSMDRLTNEKMMAVNEYSDTVLEQINKNHKEAVFLYDMLNDKHENLKTAITEADKKAGEIRQTVKDAEITAKEAGELAKEAGELVREVKENADTEISDVPVQAEEKEFTPITLTGVKVIPALPPEEEKTEPVIKTESVIKTEKPKEEDAPRKTSRRPRSVKTAGKGTASPELHEVEVSLNTEGKIGRKNNNERILELHKAGKSNMAIARELGLGIGEVKLVIDLFEGI